MFIQYKRHNDKIQVTTECSASATLESLPSSCHPSPPSPSFGQKKLGSTLHCNTYSTFQVFSPSAGSFSYRSQPDHIQDDRLPTVGFELGLETDTE